MPFTRDAKHIPAIGHGGFQALHVPKKSTFVCMASALRDKALKDKTSFYWTRPWLTYVYREEVRLMIAEAKQRNFRVLLKPEWEMKVSQLESVKDIWAVWFQNELTLWGFSRSKLKLLEKLGYSSEMLPCYLPGRVKQLQGTCYFNAALHVLTTGPLLRPFVLHKVLQSISSLTRQQQRTIFEKPMVLSIDSCPLISSRFDVLRLLFNMLSDYGPTQLSKTKFNGFGLRSTASGLNIASNLIHATGLRNTTQSPEEGDPVSALEHLLKYCRIYMHTTSSLLTLRDLQNHPLLALANHRVFPLAICFTQYQPVRVVQAFGQTYVLDSCMLLCEFPGVVGHHAIVGTFCGSLPVIYDSNFPQAEELDWTVPDLSVYGPSFGYMNMKHIAMVYVVQPL